MDLSGRGGHWTLLEYAGKGGADVGDDLAVLLAHIQHACKRIAAVVASPFNAELGRHGGGGGGDASLSSGRDAPKPLDIVSHDIIFSSLQSSGKVAVMASEEDDVPLWITDGGPFVVVTDPLDGSRNIDVSIPTGTIFGIYSRLAELDHLPVEEKAQLNSLQSGQIYSVNDARYFDWPDGLRQYIDTVRQGKGQFPKKYSARYVCSLVADFHRTLIYGGVVMNPRDHLRLVYEANPLSFLVEHAGGRGSDGKSRILSIQPVELHQRLPLFLGSVEDMQELESYDNVQQKINPGYEV
ncbi:fructose-1,6-bisphosphatase 1, chloroplastic [Cocos nucifera]|uniref:fructose-bisphosphatase n=1 Tax=Cocos nucifera TaxID=13894 RepID=A0A8K0IQL5_COCNU|nr:fructose-1,6-bisphosphatase 1, chloroplastic [Cocos nucifera]